MFYLYANLTKEIASNTTKEEDDTDAQNKGDP